ncbi:MAG: rhodanese-like domain-containing protein [Bacteroidota bacterium]
MKKSVKPLNYLVLSCMVVAMMACGVGATASADSSAPERQVAQAVTAEELQGLLQTPDDNRVVLDVRTPAEVAEGIIEGAMVMDFRSADFETLLQKLDRDKHYFVVCASGRRSGRTQAIMNTMGFGQVTNVEGGMNGWKAKGYPVVGVE